MSTSVVSTAKLIVQQFIQKPVHGNVGDTGKDNVISLIQQREEQAAERCHAGSQHHAISPPSSDATRSCKYF